MAENTRTTSRQRPTVQQPQEPPSRTMSNHHTDADLQSPQSPQSPESIQSPLSPRSPDCDTDYLPSPARSAVVRSDDHPARKSTVQFPSMDMLASPSVEDWRSGASSPTAITETIGLRVSTSRCFLVSHTELRLSPSILSRFTEGTALSTYLFRLKLSHTPISSKSSHTCVTHLPHATPTGLWPRVACSARTSRRNSSL